MEMNRPKRRKDKYNPYTIAIKNESYWISFKDGENVFHELEITKELYEAFDSFELQDLSHLNEWDRHIEHSELGESTIERRRICRDNSLEEEVIKKIQMQELERAITSLPEIQQRRIRLYFSEEMTYEQIAGIEGCTKRAVKFSIDIALAKLKNVLCVFCEYIKK